MFHGSSAAGPAGTGSADSLAGRLTWRLTRVSAEEGLRLGEQLVGCLGASTRVLRTHGAILDS